jgi:hypothetical protein
VLCASCHLTFAAQRRSKRLLAYAAAISSADSSTNTRPAACMSAASPPSAPT